MALVGAFASASASAITPVYLLCLEKEGAGTRYATSSCSPEKSPKGKFELVPVTEELGVNGTGGLSTLKTKLDGATLVITCSKSTFTGNIGPKGLSNGTVTYGGCKAFSPEGTELVNCEVANIKFKFVDQLIENAKHEIEDEFKPATGSTFVEIELLNKGASCIQKGTYKVEGTQNAEVEQGPGAKLLRELTFKESGSHLTFGPSKEKATYEGKVSIDLNDDCNWGASIP
jgi:hypothetical protein